MSCKCTEARVGDLGIRAEVDPMELAQSFQVRQPLAVHVGAVKIQTL